MAINFFEEGVQSKIKQKRKTKDWINKAAKEKGFHISTLNYIFCTDDYLLQINRNYLNHNTYTDIITFDQAEQEGEIEGDIYISIERVKENATSLGVIYHEELLRVLIHGMLHLCGLKDKSQKEKKRMREEEEKALNLFQTLSVPRGTP
ncbi:rRNA maturation RNase YbeY [Cyclobacterium plantarum]|uniref:Endoribonuclease YbeY n=1 Tax=Cyclobacterium plantarum TaxID=2716263 RepID=A0ABX0HGM7_9BACT|nr:rRNA maturation RNase YbeY [Cyclobacterium plantarum]NHE59281.1 rRNA maturation RNase YbeY [Cyclobacterium plantarum]